MMFRFEMVVLVTLMITCTEIYYMKAKADSGNGYKVESARASLVRQEDTIVYGIIERARFPFNSPTYQCKNTSSIPGFHGSILDFLANNTEAIQAKAGRYNNPEENPFFPENLPSSAIHYNFSQFLHPAAASVNINKLIWKMYFELLPSFVASGEDGNYAQTAATDFSLLQAISRRIHYGKFVAEAKFRASRKDYEPLIRDKNKEGLLKLLTVKSVEETVIKRVAKKAMVFGQEVEVNDNGNVNGKKYKVDPLVLSRLYEKWVIPFTKIVQVEYLLRRLD